MIDRLLVFLGNPGKNYKETRHNLAWIFQESLPWDNLTWKEKFHSQFCRKEDWILLKPMTMMNRSGQAVKKASSFFSLSPQQILVVHDDLELPFGSVAYKSGGGYGGHNGLKSLGEHLGTREFHRLRLGIGRPNKGSVSNWVLSPFSAEEKPWLENYCRGSQDLFFQILDNSPPRGIVKVV